MRALSPEDMDIATMLWRQKTHEEIAAKYGCSTKTIQRKKASREFIRYIENLSQGTAAQVAEIAAEVGRTLWNYNEASRRLLQIADNPKAKNSDRIAAIKVLNDISGTTKAPTAEGEQPEKPDVYQAEWMRKPQ